MILKNYLPAILLCALLSSTVGAEETLAVKDGKPGVETVDSKSSGSDWSFGLQAAPLVFGLSLRRRLNDQWQVQGMLAPYGDEVAIGARVLRVSTRKQYWHSYLYSGIAIKNSDSYYYDNDSFTDSVETYTETVGTIGLGVEWAWAAKNASLPPLSWSLELGLGYRNENYENTEVSNSDEVFLAFGAGIHYQFE